MILRRSFHLKKTFSSNSDVSVIIKILRVSDKIFYVDDTLYRVFLLSFGGSHCKCGWHIGLVIEISP